MARVNFRQQRQQRELARKQRQAERLARRGERPVDESSAVTSRDPKPADSPK